MSSDVVVRGTVLPLTEEARNQFAQGQIDLILASKARGADMPTLHAFLELAARYDLDPFANEIWCAPMGGRDGAGGKLAILVGRDGYLKVAKRDSAFVKCSGAAVYANDEFHAWLDEDESVGWHVTHQITAPADRGEALGAWATLVRVGKPTEFFFARLDQFKKASSSAWKYEDTMSIKCAVSYLLRTTYGISGAAPADELAVGLEADGSPAVGDTPQVENDALPAEVRALFERTRAVDSLAWRENELRARLDGTDVAYDELVGELKGWLDSHEPADAEVVPDDEPEAEAEVEGEPEAAPEVEGESLSPNDRYAADEEWREQVDVLMHRHADLTAALDEAGEDAASEIIGELAGLDDRLRDIGVPDGWTPGQSSLGI